jgi:hypothetical protein
MRRRVKYIVGVTRGVVHGKRRLQHVQPVDQQYHMHAQAAITTANAIADVVAAYACMQYIMSCSGQPTWLGRQVRLTLMPIIYQASVHIRARMPCCGMPRVTPIRWLYKQQQCVKSFQTYQFVSVAALANRTTPYLSVLKNIQQNKLEISQSKQVQYIAQDPGLRSRIAAAAVVQSPPIPSTTAAYCEPTMPPHNPHLRGGLSSRRLGLSPRLRGLSSRRRAGLRSLPPLGL